MKGFLLITLLLIVSSVQSLIHIDSTADKDLYTTSERSRGIVDSLNACFSHGLKPAEIKNLEENTIASNYLQQLPNPNEAIFWTTASDFYHEGTYTWLKDQSELNWLNFDPNSTNHKARNCARILRNGLWEYSACSYTNAYPLCENYKNQTSFISKKGKFSNNKNLEIKKFENKGNLKMIKSEKKTYWLGPDQGMDYMTCMTYCQENNLNMASAVTVDEQLFLIQLAKDLQLEGEFNFNFWLAGTDFFAKKNETNYYWLRHAIPIHETQFLSLTPADYRYSALLVRTYQIETTDAQFGFWRVLCEDL